MKDVTKQTSSFATPPLGKSMPTLKVCGMLHNASEVATLQPDYLGFIFWEPSSRYYHGEVPQLDGAIKKIGVFVDAALDEVLKTIKKYQLTGVQLHGHESPDFCKNLRYALETSGYPLSIIKVFSIKDSFDFTELEAYENLCDYYLFDTKGKLPGGNGYAFDWKVLQDYPSTKPYFLSGGIGMDNLEDIQAFLGRKESKYCHAIDVNSGFETKPGLKDIKKLKKFANKLKELTRAL